MNKPVKTKLCWNCEGSVSRTVENCPYCGVYLSPDSSVAADRASPTLLKPPYTPEPVGKENPIPQPPYQPSDQSEEALLREEAGVKAFSQENPVAEVFLPVLLLTAGSLALFFASILFLFAIDGTLTLQWDGEVWYIYALAAFPLLLCGWYALTRNTE